MQALHVGQGFGAVATDQLAKILVAAGAAFFQRRHFARIFVVDDAPGIAQAAQHGAGAMFVGGYDALLVVVVRRGFFGSGEDAAHHHGIGAQRQCGRNLAAMADTVIEVVTGIPVVWKGTLL